MSKITRQMLKNQMLLMSVAGMTTHDPFLRNELGMAVVDTADLIVEDALDEQEDREDEEEVVIGYANLYSRGLGRVFDDVDAALTAASTTPSEVVKLVAVTRNTGEVEQEEPPAEDEDDSVKTDEETPLGYVGPGVYELTPHGMRKVNVDRDALPLGLLDVLASLSGLVK